MTVLPKPSNFATNRRGLDLVVAEIERRGGRGWIISEGRRREIHATGSDSRREVAIQVKARTRGDWQTSIEYGRQRNLEEMPSRFWILVDLQPSKPLYYVVPEWWIQNDIWTVHHRYIDPRGGHRAVNDDSVHHSIGTSRVADWLDRWDELGIFSSS